MRYLALAADYDGTLAHDGIVDDETVAALDRVKASGRKLLLVTGRELDDLRKTFPHVDKFDRVVAENGALLYDPATGRETPLAEAPPREFADTLRQRGATPFSFGRVIVATREPWQQLTLDLIREFGLELQVIFNKGAVMVLPTGVNKATGLRSALEELGLSRHNTAGIGDAENDHAFLSACECSVAVANALDALKNRADFVTKGARGAGVQELIQQLLHDDLGSFAPKLVQHDVLIGNAGAREVRVPVHGATVLVAGTSGGGKSTLTTGFVERLANAEYQFCAVDPEGDYQTFPSAVILGDSKAPPIIDEVLSVLEKPGRNVIVNLVGVRFEHRPSFFDKLMEAAAKLRERTARPNWMVIDEAHHVMPVEEIHAPALGENTFLITLEPDALHPEVLKRVTHLIIIGEHPAETAEIFATATACAAPEVQSEPLEKGTAIFWPVKDEGDPILFKVAEADTQRVRHSRKYASADLTPDRSFYFRGPESKLNLRAQNLMVFLQMLDGVDDETWNFHLERAEYSQWFRDNIKNDEMADEAARIEQSGRPAAETRAAIREVVEQRYTLPA